MKNIDFELLETHIQYKSGYKYQLRKNASIRINLQFIKHLDIPFITYINGVLIAKFGYAWDGPSGPTVDTKNFMRGSLFHDVFFQLIREGYLSDSYYELANILLYRICEIDKMSLLRRSYVYEGVDLFGEIWNKSKDVIITVP